MDISGAEAARDATITGISVPEVVEMALEGVREGAESIISRAAGEYPLPS